MRPRDGCASKGIPSTWARGAADGDGVRDPNDLDDAALGTARYLCASGADLTAAHGWTDAVRSYNHSDVYVSARRRRRVRESHVVGQLTCDGVTPSILIVSV